MKKLSALVAFCVLFYIAQLFFAPSYHASTILAQPNTAKEFAQAEYLNESTDSIELFSETLDDDVFFTPDGFYDDTPITAINGNDDWEDCTLADSINWTITFVGGAEYAEFHGDHAIEGFAFAIFGYSAIVDNNVSVWDPLSDEMVTIATLSSSGGNVGAWYNETYFGPISYYEPSAIYLSCEPTSGYLSIDYIEVTFYYMPLTNPENEGFYGKEAHYAESFSNVSDWTTVIGNPITSNGDEMAIHLPNDSTNDVFQTNSPSISNALGYYIEIRWRNNISGALFVVYGFPEDDRSGVGYLLTVGNQETTTTSKTAKYYVDDNYAIECVAIYAKCYGAADTAILLDYLRISPADEMGWQHDGSTTEGISSTDGGTIASDGDKITLTADGDGSTFLIVADTTTTATAISCTYYPFFSMSITSGSGSWTLEQYDGSAYATLQSSTSISAGTTRFNMRALDTYVEWWRITLTASGSLVFDWAKAYSIANFTITQSGLGTDEYAFVTGGELQFVLEGDTDYIQLDYDPAVSITTLYNNWSLSVDHVLNETATDYGIRFYAGAWQAWSYDISGGSMPSVTTTDFQIISYDSYTLVSLVFINVHQWHLVDSEMVYFDIPNWHVVESIIVIFWTPINELALNMLLVFGGLILLPASMLYLVKGGKNDMSTDKVFFFLIAFMLGWALFLGGIYT